jgi:hypothetical protein
MKTHKVRTSKVLKSFGQWVVTTYGLECTTTPYPIDRRRLGERTWRAHVCAKEWVDRASFEPALDYARQVHRKPCLGPELTDAEYV